MSAIIAKQLTPGLDTQHANTRFLCISLYRVFLCTRCVFSTNTTAYLGIHIGISLISFIITHLKTETSDVSMFCGGQMLEVFFLLYLWSPLHIALCLDEQTHFCSIGCKEENGPFLSILNAYEITTFHLADLCDPFSCWCMNIKERDQLIL